MLTSRLPNLNDKYYYAQHLIYENYGHKVDIFRKAKILDKFGENLSVGSTSDYWIIEAIQAEVLERNAANATIQFQVREVGGIWKTKKTLSASNNHIGETPESWFYIVPPNSDVRLQARSDGASIAVAGNMFGRLATIL